MKKLCSALLFVFITGCTSTQYFRFSSEPVSLGTGVVGTKVVANLGYDGPLSSVYGNPYSFQVFFETKIENGCPASVQNIKIAGVNGEALYQFSGGDMDAQWVEYPGHWYCKWSPDEPGDKLEFEHVQMSVEFDLMFINDGHETLEHVERTVSPILKEEERSNVVRDGILSV